MAGHAEAGARVNEEATSAGCAGEVRRRDVEAEMTAGALFRELLAG